MHTTRVFVTVDDFGVFIQPRCPFMALQIKGRFSGRRGLLVEQCFQRAGESVDDS